MRLARIPRNEWLKDMYLIILHGATIEYRATDVQQCPRISQVRNKHVNRILVVRNSKFYACSNTDLSEFLFHYVMFCNIENRDLSSKIYCVSFDGIT